MPGFWRWLSKVLVESIRKVPGLIGGIRSPLTEIIIGMTGIAFSLVLAVASYDVSFYTRVVLALLTIPSFLISMHGFYRAEDC